MFVQMLCRKPLSNPSAAISRSRSQDCPFRRSGGSRLSGASSAAARLLSASSPDSDRQCLNAWKSWPRARAVKGDRCLDGASGGGSLTAAAFPMAAETGATSCWQRPEGAPGQERPSVCRSAAEGSGQGRARSIPSGDRDAGRGRFHRQTLRRRVGKPLKSVRRAPFIRSRAAEASRQSRHRIRGFAIRARRRNCKVWRKTMRRAIFPLPESAAALSCSNGAAAGCAVTRTRWIKRPVLRL